MKEERRRRNSGLHCEIRGRKGGRAGRDRAYACCGLQLTHLRSSGTGRPPVIPCLRDVCRADPTDGHFALSPFRVFLAIGAVGAAVAVAVAGSLEIGVLRKSRDAVRKIERTTPTRRLRAELPRSSVGAAGWTWAVGVPGFHDRREERFWNGFRLPDSLRARFSASARAGGLGDVRVLRALTIPRSSRILAVAAAGARDGANCIVASGNGLPASFHCVRQGSPAAKASAIVAVATDRPDPALRSGWSLNLLGVARGDVQRIRFVTTDGDMWHLYSREPGYLWGTFALGIEVPHAFSGRLAVERVGGTVDSVELSSARQSTTSFLVTPSLSR